MKRMECTIMGTNNSIFVQVDIRMYKPRMATCVTLNIVKVHSGITAQQTHPHHCSYWDSCSPLTLLGLQMLVCSWHSGSWSMPSQTRPSPFIIFSVIFLLICSTAQGKFCHYFRPAIGFPTSADQRPSIFDESLCQILPSGSKYFTSWNLVALSYI